MFAILAIVVHVLVSTPAALILAPLSISFGADTATMWTLSLASAFFSGLGLLGTTTYLAKRVRPVTGVITGLACGLTCSGILGLSLRGMDFSLIVYLTLLVPTLVAVTLASALDRPRTGWA